MVADGTLSRSALGAGGLVEQGGHRGRTLDSRQSVGSKIAIVLPRYCMQLTDGRMGTAVALSEPDWSRRRLR